MNSDSQRRAAIRVTLCAAVVVALAMGIRHSFGLFMHEGSVALGDSRTAFSLAIALQNLLWGLMQPGVGMLADRFGQRLIAVGGGLLYVGGLTVAAAFAGAVAINLGLGLLVGLGLSATAFVVALGAVARIVPVSRRGLAFGLVTAAGSFGMFGMVPVAQALLSVGDWRSALFLLAGLAMVISLVALGFPGPPRRNAAVPGLRLGEALRQAASHRGYWLLNGGFFVCGFHVAFIATHLPAFLQDSGLTTATATAALALIGLFNMVGSLAFGMLGDRVSKPRLLSSLYAARVLVIVVFLLVPLTTVNTLLFAAVIGFLWLGTIPLTSGLVAQIFGPAYMGTLFGIVFLSHQLGSFSGAWLGGFAFDLTGSYDAVWLLAIALGVLATLLHLPISDRPVRGLQPAA